MAHRIAQPRGKRAAGSLCFQAPSAFLTEQDSLIFAHPTRLSSLPKAHISLFFLIFAPTMHKHFLISLLLCLLGLGTAMAQLPSVPLKTTQGKILDSNSLGNEGKPFVISFFATWCKPCLRELSAIAEEYDEWREETGVKLIAVSIDEAQNEHKVKPLADQHGWDYEVLLDPNSNFLRALGGKMVPFVVVCNAQGKIVYRHSGYTEGGEADILEAVRQTLQR